MSYKKIYSTPILEIERFDMDIDIAAIDPVLLESLKILFESVYGRKPEDDAEFQAWLATQPGYDNSSSGICYYTAGNLS